MMHPDTELRYINDEIGYGVFATRFIPKGTITWALDPLDQQFDESYLNSLDDLQRDRLIKYSYRDERGIYILCWDVARYMNHSFDSNCIATAYRLELAARDIQAGEELTDDYGYFNLDKPFYCLPEPGTDRTCVLPDDLLLYYPIWDRQAASAMRYFNAVSQPLKYLIDRPILEKMTEIAGGRAGMDSILHCYYSRYSKPKKLCGISPSAVNQCLN